MPTFRSIPSSVLCLLAALLCADARAGSIIKCRAADGAITFADTRCPAGQQQLSKKTAGQRSIDTRGSLKNLENGSEYPPAENTATPREKLLFAAQFTEALGATEQLRLNLLEYYLVNGEWPGAFEDMGLSGKAMTSSTISASRLLDNGRLVFSLVGAFGEGKQIVLAPTEVMSGTRIEWRCYSNFPAAMLVHPLGKTLCLSRYF